MKETLKLTIKLGDFFDISDRHYCISILYSTVYKYKKKL